MAEYDSAIALATRLIAQKGEDLTLRQFPVGTPNVSQPWRPGTPSPDHVDTTGVRGVFLNFKSNLLPSLRYADGTQVQAGDKRVLITGALTPAPSLGDILVRLDAKLWSVKNVKCLDPNGQKVLFELWVQS